MNALSALTLATSVFLLSGMTAPMPEQPVSGQPTKARTFAVDTVHSSVMFKVKHLNTSWFYGRFNTIKGAIAVGGDDSSVNLIIDAKSADSANDRRDRHLHGPDFFNVKQFPEIKFESTSVRVSKSGHLDVKGKLTLRGKTKEIQAIANKVGEGKARGGAAIVGYHTVFTIKRSDFGMTYGKGALSDDVEVTISVECKEQK